MTNLHATALGTYNVCPYKFMFDKSDPEIKNLFPGDILNIAMVSDGETEPFLKYFTKYFNGDYKLCMMLQKIYDTAREYKNVIKKEHPMNYQETKFYYRINPDLILVGTPDFFFFDEKEQIRTIIDWKTSASFQRYKDEDIWNESFQPNIYSLFLMEYFQVDKVKFQFVVFSKTNGEMQTFERPEELGGKYFTKDKVYSAVLQKAKEFEESSFNDEWKPKTCRFCSFCPLRKGECPMYNKRVEVKEEL